MVYTTFKFCRYYHLNPQYIYYMCLCDPHFLIFVNFCHHQGVAGEQGESGLQGIAGLRGESGADGAPGQTGPAVSFA